MLVENISYWKCDLCSNTTESYTPERREQVRTETIAKGWVPVGSHAHVCPRCAAAVVLESRSVDALRDAAGAVLDLVKRTATIINPEFTSLRSALDRLNEDDIPF